MCVPMLAAVDTGPLGPWADLYSIYTVASLVVLLSCLFVRVAFGASPAYLARTRCYELPPARLLFHTVHAGVWLAFLTAAVLTVRHGWAYYQTSADPHGTAALAAAGAAVVLGGVGWVAFLGLIHIPDNRPPAAAVRGVTTTEGIDRHRLANLGREQFPQMLAYGHTAGCWVRGLLVLAGFACLAVVVAAGTDWGRQSGLYAAGTDIIRVTRGALPPVPEHWGVAAGLTAGLGLALLLLSNPTYTLLRFPQTLAVGAVLAAVGWAAAAVVGAPDDRLGVLAGGLGLAFGARWVNDLYRAFGFKRILDVTEPIARRLADEVPDLDAMRTRPDCRLDTLDAAALRERITDGCRNVEEAGPLVTRNLARFLDLVRIEYEHFTAAMLRYLTVRRYVARIEGGGTRRPLQYPVVPVWNEVLFPLYPPAGYRDWLDPLPLGAEWDIVETCPSPCSGTGRVPCTNVGCSWGKVRCNGSNCSYGRVRRTETYNEYSGGQSVTRTREWEESCGTCGGSGQLTCSTCNGTGQVTCGRCKGDGRLVHHQTLNTQWQRLIPTCTAPHVLLPEFMADAEERVYYRLPVVEDREPLGLDPENGGIDQDLFARLDRVVPALSAELPEFVRAVEQLHDGYLYRADFQVTGFWVLRIAFRRLPGKVGWFFGRRPEFHFPALPLSWGAVGTVLFVLPFIALTVLGLVALSSAWLQAMLPPVH